MATDISASASATSGTSLNAGSDDLRLVVDLTGLATNTKALKQEHIHSRKAKRRKLRSFRCLVRVEVFSLASPTIGRASLYCLTKEATLTTKEEGEKFIFGLILDEPFTINTASLLSKTPRGTGWTRSLAQDYTVTISILFHSDVDLRDVLEVASLTTNDEEVILASTFRISRGDGDARRAQLKQYTTKASDTTNLNMVAKISWKESCSWCAEERWFTTGVEFDEHIKNQHGWAPRMDASVTESDSVGLVSAPLNMELVRSTKHRPMASVSSAMSDESLAAPSTRTNAQTPKDPPRLPKAGNQQDFSTSIGSLKLSDVTVKAWEVTPEELKETFGHTNMLDQHFVKILNELAAATTFEAAKEEILRIRRLKHYKQDLKQCAVSNLKEAIERLRPKADLRRSSKAQAGNNVNTSATCATQNRVVDDSGSSSRSLRLLKSSNRSEITAGPSPRDAQNSDDHVRLVNAKQFRSLSQAPAKPSPFQAARASSSSRFGDPETSKVGNLNFNGFNTTQRVRDNRHKRVIPESPSMLEESLVEKRGNTRVDAGMGLNESIKTRDVFSHTHDSGKLSALGATNSATENIARSTSPGQLVDQPQGLSGVRGLPQPRSIITTVPSRPGHTLQLFEETTFRPLLSGSEVMGSEQQIDETWLRMKQDQKVDSYSNMTSIQKCLMKRWNHQMLEEKLSGDKFLPDATMRFVAANRSWLKEDNAFREFIRFLGALRADKLVSDVVVKACVDALRGTAISPKDPVGPLTTRAKARASLNAAISTKKWAARSYLPLAEVSEVPYISEKRSDWAATCVCGETVDGAGKIMLCSNTVSFLFS